MALNNDTAKKLFDLGVLTEDTYNKIAAPNNSSALVKPEQDKVVDAIVAKSVPPKPKADDGYGDAEGLISAIQKGPVQKGYENVSTALAGPQDPNKLYTPMASGKGASGSWGDETAPATPGQAPAGGLASDIPSPQAQQDQAVAAQRARSNARQGNLEQGYNIQQEAIMKGAQAGAAQAAAESAHLQKTYDETERMRTEEMAREVERRERLKGDEDLLRTAIDKYQATPATTQEKFANMDTGQKIMTGIALFLGAAPNSSGGNRAVDVMQRAVDADLAKAKQGVNDRNSLYKEMKDTFGDERQAEAATRLAYIQNAQLKLQQVAAQYKGPQIKANAEALYGQLEVAKQAQMLQFEQAAQLNPSMQMADQMTKDIYRLPKDLQGKAMEERGIIDNLNNANTQISALLKRGDKATGLGSTLSNAPFVGGALGGWTSGAKEVAEVGAQVAALLTANWKGPMTEQEAKKIIGPYLPSITDSDEDVERKIKGLQNLMKMNAKPTPILEGFGMKPKTDAEKYPDKKSND